MEPADDARRGGLADLVTTEYPEVRLSDMTLAPATRAQLEQVLHEQRQRDLLESRGFAPLHRLLLTGPPGTGKSMTASALATELSLPLVTIRIDALISKYTGETAAKLRVIFDAMARPRSVYLFDDLDAIAARQMAGFGLTSWTPAASSTRFSRSSMTPSRKASSSRWPITHRCSTTHCSAVLTPSSPITCPIPRKPSTYSADASVP